MHITCIYHVQFLLLLDEFACDKCSRKFTLKCNLRRHYKHCANLEKLICDVCGKYEAYRKDNLKRHHLTCLKRLTNNVFDSEDDSFSNSSGVSDVNVDIGDRRVPAIHIPPLPI